MRTSLVLADQVVRIKHQSLVFATKSHGLIGGLGPAIDRVATFVFPLTHDRINETSIFDVHS